MGIFFVFVLGAVLGSFTLVFIERVMSGKGLGGRSRCDHCKVMLKAADMIPVLSFLFLQGACRHCKNHISRWHFVVEVLLGVGFVAGVFYVPAVGPQDVFIRLFVLSVLFCLFVFDTRYGLLPGLISIPAAVFVFFYMWLVGSMWEQMAGGAMIGAGVFALQYIISRGRWVGRGDIWLGAFSGVVLGVVGVALGIVLAYVVGAIVVGVLLLAKRKKRGDVLPMGAFLIPATVVVWYFHDHIIQLFV